MRRAGIASALLYIIHCQLYINQVDFRHDILPLKNIIFRTALRIILNREEAEDIVQDTLVKLWERRGELDEVRTWRPLR